MSMTTRCPIGVEEIDAKRAKSEYRYLDSSEPYY